MNGRDNQRKINNKRGSKRIFEREEERDRVRLLTEECSGLLEKIR